MAEPTPVPEGEGADSLPRTEVDMVARLEGMRERLTQGFGVFNRTLWVDRDEVANEIRELIALLPREIKRARRVVQEEEGILDEARKQAAQAIEDARAEADEILKAAREETERLVDASNIKQMAVEQAEKIVNQAQEHAGEVQQKAYDYAHEVLSTVEKTVQNALSSVQQGKEQVRPKDEPGT